MSPHALAAPAVPASLDLPRLTELTRRYADEVRARLHRVVVDPEQRWYNLLRSDDTVDVWLITWATEIGRAHV